MSIGTKVKLADSAHSIRDNGSITSGTVTGSLDLARDTLDGAVDVSGSFQQDRELHNVKAHAYGPGAAGAKGYDPAAVPPGMPESKWLGAGSKGVID